MPNGLIYAQELLKLASLEEVDALSWLQFNWQAYPYRFVQGVLLQTVNSTADAARKKHFKDLLAGLDDMYGVPPDDSRMATIEGKLSSMMRGFGSGKTPVKSAPAGETVSTPTESP